LTCSKIACESFIFRTDLEAGSGHSALVAWMTLCEAATNFCIGVAFVLDVYGQMLMPVQYLYFFYSLFLGVGLFWSIAVALTIREDVRYLRDFTPRRPVLIAFKWSLRAILGNGLILDLMLPFRMIFPSIAGGSTFPYILIVHMSSVMMLQCSAAVWFLYQAWLFRRTIMPYVRSHNDLNTGDTEPSDKSKKIRSLEKIMNYMAINGAMLMVSFFTFVSMSMSLYGLVSFQFWECRVFSWAISRIAITYSQVKMIAKNKVNTTRICGYRCSCFRERMPVSPQDEPPEIPSTPPEIPSTAIQILSTSIQSNQIWAMFFNYRPDSNAGDPDSNAE